MPDHEQPPAGPRGAVGALAEDAAAAYLQELGWTVLARNLRVGRDELDIVAWEPGLDSAIVIVEVRSRSGTRFGHALESVDRRKVTRLYRALTALRRSGHEGLDLDGAHARRWRVDLLALARSPGSDWSVEAHLRGLAPP